MIVNERSAYAQEEFLQLGFDQVDEFTPSTVIYAASGTRRAAALAGISDVGDDFANWTQNQLFRSVDIFFKHGVRHLFMPMLGPSQFSETTSNYHQHLWRWFIDGLAGDKAIAHYQSHGWRVRIAFSAYMPQVEAGAARLVESTAHDSDHTLWCYAVPEYSQVWEWVQIALGRDTASSQSAVQAIYGEDIPPAELYIGTGKPQLSSLQLPPFLVSEVMQCYWSQRPGYSLDQEQLRRMLYDAAFLRNTWRADKSGRAKEALAQRELWEQGSIFGLGRRVGPFWYPQEGA